MSDRDRILAAQGREPRHRFEEIDFEVSFGSEAAARAEIPELEVWMEGELLPALESVLDALSPADRHHRIDSLDLDLGDVPYRGFREEILARLVERIEAELEGSDGDGNQAQPLPEASLLSGLESFLVDGIWRFEGVDGNAHQGILEQLLQSDPAGLVTLLRKGAAGGWPIPRLVRQFPKPQLASILGRLVVDPRRLLSDLADLVELEAASIDARGPGGLVEAFWEASLSACLARAARPGVEEVQNGIFGDLASRRGMSPADLAVQLLGRFVDLPRSSVQRMSGLENWLRSWGLREPPSSEGGAPSEAPGVSMAAGPRPPEFPADSPSPARPASASSGEVSSPREGLSEAQWRELARWQLLEVSGVENPAGIRWWEEHLLQGLAARVGDRYFQNLLEGMDLASPSRSWDEPLRAGTGSELLPSPGLAPSGQKDASNPISPMGPPGPEAAWSPVGGDWPPSLQAAVMEALQTVDLEALQTMWPALVRRQRGLFTSLLRVAAENPELRHRWARKLESRLQIDLVEVLDPAAGRLLADLHADSKGLRDLVDSFAARGHRQWWEPIWEASLEHVVDAGRQVPREPLLERLLEAMSASKTGRDSLRRRIQAISGHAMELDSGLAAVDPPIQVAESSTRDPEVASGRPKDRRDPPLEEKTGEEDPRSPVGIGRRWESPAGDFEARVRNALRQVDLDSLREMWPQLMRQQRRLFARGLREECADPEVRRVLGLRLDPGMQVDLIEVLSETGGRLVADLFGHVDRVRNIVAPREQGPPSRWQREVWCAALEVLIGPEACTGRLRLLEAILERMLSISQVRRNLDAQFHPLGGEFHGGEDPLSRRASTAQSLVSAKQGLERGELEFDRRLSESQWRELTQWYVLEASALEIPLREELWQSVLEQAQSLDQTEAFYRGVLSAMVRREMLDLEAIAADAVGRPFAGSAAAARPWGNLPMGTVGQESAIFQQGARTGLESGIASAPLELSQALQQLREGRLDLGAAVLRLADWRELTRGYVYGNPRFDPWVREELWNSILEHSQGLVRADQYFRDVLDGLIHRQGLDLESAAQRASAGVIRRSQGHVAAAEAMPGTVPSQGSEPEPMPLSASISSPTLSDVSSDPSVSAESPRSDFVATSARRSVPSSASVSSPTLSDVSSDPSVFAESPRSDFAATSTMESVPPSASVSSPTLSQVSSEPSVSAELSRPDFTATSARESAPPSVSISSPALSNISTYPSAALDSPRLVGVASSLEMQGAKPDGLLSSAVMAFLSQAFGHPEIQPWLESRLGRDRIAPFIQEVTGEVVQGLALPMDAEAEPIEPQARGWDWGAGLEPMVAAVKRRLDLPDGLFEACEVVREVAASAVESLLRQRNQRKIRSNQDRKADMSKLKTILEILGGSGEPSPEERVAVLAAFIGESSPSPGEFDNFRQAIGGSEAIVRRLVRLVPDAVLEQILSGWIRGGFQIWACANLVAEALEFLVAASSIEKLRESKWIYLFQASLGANAFPGTRDFAARFAAILCRESGIADVGLAQQFAQRRVAQHMPEASAPAIARPALAKIASGAGGLAIGNAGMVLVAPYLPRLFGMLDLVVDGAFVDFEASEKAVHLLQILVNDPEPLPEYLLSLNKFLCGIDNAVPIRREVDISAKEREICDSMLQALIQHWSALGNTSVAGLQDTFLRREGQFGKRDGQWHLVVQKGAFDMLMDKLPWSFSLIKYGWMDEALHVEW